MTDIQISDISANVSAGGWEATGQVFRDADALEQDRQLILFSDIFGLDGSSHNIVSFNGHVQPEPWYRNFLGSNAGFRATTCQEYFKRERIQGIFFTDRDPAANQHQIPNMTYARIFEHCIGKVGEFGHCNLSLHAWPAEGIADLDINFDDSTEIDEWEMKEGIFWTRMRELAEPDFYYLTVTKENVIRFDIHPMFKFPLPAPKMIIDEDNILEPLVVTPRYVVPGQVIIDGTTPAGVQFRGKYPSQPDSGEVFHQSGYVSKNSSKVAALAERTYRFEARDTSATLTMGGPVGLAFELFDRVYVNAASAEDGQLWTNKDFWIHGIRVAIDNERLTAQTEIQLEAGN